MCGQQEYCIDDRCGVISCRIDFSAIGVCIWSFASFLFALAEPRLRTGLWLRPIG